jgi:hypothetical protein
MDLFLDDPKGLPKTAAAFTRLSENPDDWQMEIINELYRQAPYVGDFDPKLVMNELDPERRYALGSVELKTKQGINPRDDRTDLAKQGVKQVLVPVVVNEGRMSPLDLFIHNGKAQPLTEKRLRRAMFRPELFEAAAKRPGDQDMMNVLYPPYRSGGFGLGGNSRVGTHETAKTGSVRPELIDAILKTVKTADVRRVEDQLNANPTLRAVALGNPAVSPFISKLAAVNGQEVQAEAMVKAAMAQVPPKVIQVIKTGGGFLIKTANPNYLFPEINKIARPEAEDIVGEDVVRQVERDGTVTVSTDPVVRDSLLDAKLQAVDEFGEYKVKTKDGNELVGWVFPRVVDLDGTNLAIAVFSNGSQSAMQENIVGSMVGKGTNIIDEDPKDQGCFYLSTGGSAVAIIPMDIKGSSVGPDGDQMFVANTIMGEQTKIKMVPGLKMISQIDENTYGIPAECGWLPLREPTALAETPDEFSKTAEARRAPMQVEVMFENGGTFSLRGLGITKAASVLPMKFIDSDQAVFNLAVLGVDPEFAKTKLAEAQKLSRWVQIDGVRPVTLASERYHHAKTAAQKFIDSMPQVKSLLLKEAAVLDDPLAVDKVLSIGFLNPENIGTFISYLPEFEDTLKKLSELLMASRLGLSVVDAGALERVVKHMDKVVDGLRVMSQQPQA